jgi:hypothetical protein
LHGACALDPDTGTLDPSSDTLGATTSTASEPASASRCDCDCPPAGPTCTTKSEGVVDLDSLPANIDHEDGRVSFCHATGSESNPYILLTTDVSGCVNGHADHEPGGNLDIFSSQGCDD